jgi:hypothetical protein
VRVMSTYPSGVFVLVVSRQRCSTSTSTPALGLDASPDPACTVDFAWPMRSFGNSHLLS